MNNVTKIRIIIAGGRDFSNYNYMCEKLDEVINDIKRTNYPCEFEFISGAARGADQLGETYARERTYKITRFPANWNKYGKAAGPIRNNEMADYAAEDGYTGILIAFWDGKSRGTKSMIDLANRHGLKVFVFNY